MALVAGVDFGTESVRVSIVDSVSGVVGTGESPLGVVRDAGDPDRATQSHRSHLDGLEAAVRSALHTSGSRGADVRAIAVDTTGSTVTVVGEGLQPLDEYYLWCDHRARDEAARITEVANDEGLPAIGLCGGAYSTEWGFSKLLHWLRHNPRRRDLAVAAVEHCDLITAVLCGITDPDQLPRSVCAMGHKWMYSAAHGGLPPEEFLRKVDPLLGGAHRLLRGRYLTSDRLAGHLADQWARKLGLAPGIPIPIGALDAHWDAVGSGIAEGDVVNVVGSSTCTMAIARQAASVPGVCGVVPGSIIPGFDGIEAGLSAVGQLFESIATRAGQSLDALSRGLEQYRAGQTGLLRFAWDNGDRTVLVNPDLAGVTIGWTLASTAQDELFAAIEGTAFHTRIILERMNDHGVPTRRLIHGGGIPQRNDVLNRVYADVLGMPVLVPERPVTSLGAAIFACVAAGVFPDVASGQRALCPPYREVRPDGRVTGIYDGLFALFRSLYFGLASTEHGPLSSGLFRQLRERGTARVG
jgi:L-ribulokinase